MTKIFGYLITAFALLLSIGHFSSLSATGIPSIAREVAAILLILSLWTLGISFIFPKLFTRFFNNQASQMRLSLVFGGAILISFYLFGITSPDNERTTAAPQVLASKPKPTPSIKTDRNKQAQTNVRAETESRQQVTEEQDRQTATGKISDSIKSYLKDFYETSWYGSVQNVTVHSNVVKVQTNMVKNEIFDGIARDVCSGVSGYVFSNSNSSLSSHAKVIRYFVPT